MTETMTAAAPPPEDPPSGAPPDPTSTSPTNPRALSEEERGLIVRLHDQGLGLRATARRTSRSRKLIKKVLKQAGRLIEGRTQPAPASKLDPFRELIKEKVERGVNTTRLLRELREQGYTGGRTILARYVGTLRAPLAPRKSVARRFETAPGDELQIDWSPYRVLLGERQRTLHAFCAALASSRYAYVRFFENERLPALLEALEGAFVFFEGVPQKVLSDNMATVVLGRAGKDRRPIWNEGYLAFAEHYGFDLGLCRVRDPDRKGIVERFFRYLSESFLAGGRLASLADLNEQVKRWLAEVANVRVHGTTGRVPEDAWREERALLIELPHARFAGACESGVRKVGPDATIKVRGTPYTVPWELAGQRVAVRLYSEHFCVLDRTGRVAFERRYVSEEERGRLQIDPTHYDGLPWPKRERGSVQRLEVLFDRRFPTLGHLAAGLKQRMKALVAVHLHQLLRLADRYGDEAFVGAAERAQRYRRYDSHAIRRILEREVPLDPLEEPIPPLGGRALLEALLDGIDEGSLDGYGDLDQRNQDSQAEGEVDHGA